MHLYKSHLFVETISVADPHSRHKRSSRKSKRSSGRSKCSSGSSVNEGQKIFSQNPETLAESFLETYKCYGKFCNLLQLVLRACMQMNFIACPYQKSSKDMAKKKLQTILVRWEGNDPAEEIWLSNIVAIHKTAVVQPSLASYVLEITSSTNL